MGFSRTALSERMVDCGVPAFHGGQVFRWLYARRQFAAERWTDLPRDLRRRFCEQNHIDPGRVADRTSAADGTVKYRIALAGGGQIESVYMLKQDRVTLCLSSQVGCALRCDFCLTGKMGLERNLDPGEILGQVALIQQEHGLDGAAFNIVFMGMGEPLHNYDAVMSAIRVLTDAQGFGLSRRRITVSTVGLAPAIERLAAEALRPRLAVSLNATTDAVRDRIMPVNRKYPLSALIHACREFLRGGRERLTLEYVLLDSVNDTDGDVKRLADIAAGIGAKINLIPHNPVPGWLDYRPPAERRVIAFRDGLLRLGARASIRWSRGAEARAACGQLALLPDAPGRGAERGATQ